MSAEIKGVWNRITIYCMNHDVPQPMSVTTNTEKYSSSFYGCSMAFPERDWKKEGLCANRLNLDDYQKIVSKVMDLIAEKGVGADLTNYSFDVRGARQKCSVKILLYTDKEIRLGILNRTVLGR